MLLVTRTEHRQRRDQLAGTSVYGTYVNDLTAPTCGAAFSIPFDSYLSVNSGLWLTSGDMQYWVQTDIMTVASFYAHAPQAGGADINEVAYDSHFPPSQGSPGVYLRNFIITNYFNPLTVSMPWHTTPVPAIQDSASFDVYGEGRYIYIKQRAYVSFQPKDRPCSPAMCCPTTWAPTSMSGPRKAPVLVCGYIMRITCTSSLDIRIRHDIIDAQLHCYVRRRRSCQHGTCLHNHSIVHAIYCQCFWPQ